MAMEVVQVQNFAHDHPLMLITKEETDDSWDLSCYGCQQPIWISSSDSSSYYGCKRCAFFLHKICAEPPDKMTHPSHPQHPLTRLPIPPYHGSKHSTDCEVCREIFNRFTYHCSVCNYDIDMKCALAVLSIQQSIKHTSHPHQLIPLQMESMFLCYACGIEHKGTSFLCTTCGFWINQKCASSPINLKLNNRHRHTLSLKYFIPGLSQEIHCSICSEEIFRRSWAYSCSECRYLVHLRCAVSDKEYSTLRSNETENQSHDLRNSGTATSDADLHKVICLPVLDDSADIFTQFIKNMAAIQGQHKEATEIKHGSHRHPLTLFEKPIDHALPLLNGAGNVQKCCGCAQRISAPFYCCVECEFYLHVWCAELPEELRQHPTHLQHTLFLTKNTSAAKCNCCNLFASTLFYECEECYFYLDCKCASLPRVIKHESHDKHFLTLRPTSSSGTCISCSASLTISFQCSGCKFNVCVRCAILPRTVQHRYDKHPFTLTYSPRPYRTDDDFCELCEEGIDSNRWFYHCGECDQYLHTGCIRPVDEFSSIVDEQWINSRTEEAQIIYVNPNPNSSCSLCRRKNPTTKSYFSPFVFCLCHDLCLSRIDLSSSNSATATLDADLYKVIYLPVPDDSADIISQFIKNTAIQGKKHKEEAEIKHDSHHHPLTLYEEPIDHALPLLNGAGNVQKCCGCAQSISAPFYCCLECKFYLHVWCAELPEELRHPGHPQHTLFLSKVNRVTKCRCCNLVGNIFFYECTECDFVLDCKCASLPRVIEHESHDKHALALWPTPFPGTCISCCASLTISFQCSGCKFNVCVRCAILPRTVRHRYDKHPFRLSYSPRLYRTDDDFCEICEEGIDSNRWFYHCGKCDQYLQTDCILPVDQFSNMVHSNNWEPINSRKHQHRLIRVAANPNTSCSLCERSNADSDHYRCPPCDFFLCDSCEEKEIEGEI